MRLEIPFFKQTTKMDCGPVALKMVLAYFGKDFPSETLEEKTGIKSEKGISTIQIATAASSLGYKSRFYSKHILFNEQLLKHEFYQKYADNLTLESSKQLVQEAKKVGVDVQEKELSLTELLGFVTQKSVPIVLIDWNVVKGSREKGYQGHFVPIVGYDEQNIYIHNHGFNNPLAFMPITRELFDEARKAEGTDEDVAIICRD